MVIDLVVVSPDEKSYIQKTDNSNIPSLAMGVIRGKDNFEYIELIFVPEIFERGEYTHISYILETEKRDELLGFLKYAATNLGITSSLKRFSYLPEGGDTYELEITSRDN